ncbi:hypothetical protein B9Z19DRAFT_1067466 [Tuber borchii]|uniref:Autophagy-related protein 13 n=1 Tax=Tuber borchii TaxID=42251 RepID=A0A2T6ZIR2_TUBBO|nr:hypothetical protein B9Z19DRAFT_1067466 [Tuber borchii]
MPDSFVQLLGGKFPTIVCETGWSESMEQLKQDARLWLLKTNGETKVVVVLAFREKYPKARDGDSFELRPPPLIIETCLDTRNLTANQSLVISDAEGEKWNVDEATDAAAARAGLNAEPRRSVCEGPARHEVILERWGVGSEASCQGAPSAANSDGVTFTPNMSNNRPTPSTAGSEAIILKTQNVINDNHGATDGPTPSAASSSPTTLLSDNEPIISTTAGCELAVPPVPRDDRQETLIAGIDEDTDLITLAERLFDLNEQGGLKPPLLGNVYATLHLFKATEAGDDIVETFFANLLPPETGAAETPNVFGITLRDLLGDRVPKGHDPAYEITFPLEDLKEVIQSSIPGTTRLRATDRAIKLVKESIGSNGEPTFAQRKRQKLDPIEIWK